MEGIEYSYLILYPILILIPLSFLLLGVLPEGNRVDPEIVNGLLTASSIIFGFALVFVGGEERNLAIAFMLTADVGILALCGSFMFFFGLGLNNGLVPLVLAASSLNANGITALYSRFLKRSERIEHLKKLAEKLQKKK